MPENGLRPYQAPALSPIEAHVFNLLCTRRQPWNVFFAGVSCLLEASTWNTFVPVCVFDVACGEKIWTVELGDFDVLTLHPALADVPPSAPLPDELRFAILELLATPLLEQAQAFLGTTLAFGHPRLGAGPHPLCYVSLVLRVPVSDTERLVPVRIGLPDRESALALVERLDALPRFSNPTVMTDVPVSVGIEAGRMRLSLHDLLGLESGDVLLPETYSAREGRLALTLPCTTAKRHIGFACSVQDGVVTLERFFNLSLQEMFMSQVPESSAVQSAPEQGVAVGELEVVLSFELERRLMTVRDVETLAPGYTFALGCDALSPVTLCVNGKAVGAGRLVDMNGTLGVQITRVHAASGTLAEADGDDRG